MSLDNLLRPRSLVLNVYLTVMTCGVWLFVWAAAAAALRLLDPLHPAADVGLARRLKCAAHLVR